MDELTPDAKVLFRRVILETAVEAGAESDQLLQGLKALGCSCEGANRRYISVNIPPDADLGVVRQYLIDHDATWEHAARHTMRCFGRRLSDESGEHDRPIRQ